MPKGTLLQTRIVSDGIELFYCEVLDKYFVKPIGDLEIRSEEIPRFSCYSCNASCHFQQDNVAYLNRLIRKIWNSRNGYYKDFLGSLKQFQMKYKPKIL